ncbi:MAG: ABC transporter ATP-binding protein [Candidatus Delongbacteria bacterium]
MYAVESKGLTKHYSRGRIKALNDLSLNVEKGRIFSLLGPNGAGKTTLMKLLLSVTLPSAGEGYILGKNIKDPRSRKKVGYLSEHHRFPGFLNAEQFLYYFGRMSLVPVDLLRRRVPVLLKKVRLEDKKLKLKKYSKGMLQRLGTAQALINDPEIIFLDEPTDGIDPAGRIEIREILLELKDKGKTVFINSHLLSEVERLSDEIAILKEGNLIKRGRVSEFILDTGKYIISVAGEQTSLLYEVLDRENITYSRVNDSVLAELSGKERMNRIIDLLRARNILITGIEKHKNTLEDYFIKVTK